jgi:spore coat protein U-like protein
MKKSMLVLAIAIVFAMVSQAFAASVAPIVTATGTVNSKCNWIADGTINFVIDPSGTGVITANTTANGTEPKVKCTKDTTYGVACTSSGSLKIGGTTDPITYTITGCATPITGKGFGSGNEVTIPVGISIAQSAYENAQAGAHADTITVTVTY